MWSIARTPASVNLLNVGSVRRKLYEKIKLRHLKKYKFNVGDFVRLSLRKGLFKKGYKANFTEEVFKLTEQLPRTPEVYKVQDLLERPISGTFYVKELQKVNRPDIFRIERFL